jgi:hypothetical protein
MITLHEKTSSVLQSIDHNRICRSHKVTFRAFATSNNKVVPSLASKQKQPAHLNAYLVDSHPHNRRQPASKQNMHHWTDINWFSCLPLNAVLNDAAPTANEIKSPGLFPGGHLMQNFLPSIDISKSAPGIVPVGTSVSNSPVGDGQYSGFAAMPSSDGSALLIKPRSHRSFMVSAEMVSSYPFDATLAAEPMRMRKDFTAILHYVTVCVVSQLMTDHTTLNLHTHFVCKPTNLIT